MPKKTTFKGAAEFVEMYYPFGVAQLAISQNAVALKLNVNEATNGSMNITGIPAQYAGSIVGLSIILTANKTAGVLTVTPTINTTAITTPSGLVAVPVANAAKSKVAVADAEGARFKQGDLLGAKVTTDANYLPTTNDMLVFLHILYENVQH